MNNKGRKVDVLFEDWKYTDQRTGVEVLAPSFFLWADAGLKELVESVEGVQNAFTDVSKNRYHIYIDPRYDREFVKREIEAAILCRGEE